jgi:hypothetical protein
MESVSDALQRQKAEQKKQDDRIIALYRSLAACVGKQALALSSSSETSDIASRAAMGLCAKEFGAYRAAISGWSAMSSPAEADLRTQSDYQRLTDQALAIIVRERQRRPN